MKPGINDIAKKHFWYMKRSDYLPLDSLVNYNFYIRTKIKSARKNVFNNMTLMLSHVKPSPESTLLNPKVSIVVRPEIDFTKTI